MTTRFLGVRVLLVPYVLIAAVTSSAAAQVDRAPQLVTVRVWRTRVQADSALARGDAETSARLYRQLVATDTADVQVWLGLATAEASLAHPAAAESAFKHVVAGGYFAGQSALQVARLAARQGKKTEALDWLDSALAHRVTSRASFQRDSAFAPYHDDPRYQALSGMLPNRPFTRDGGWRYDLAFFAAEARRLHTGFDRPAFSDSFAAAVRRLDQRIPSLSDGEVLAGLQQIATLLGDGHSGVYRRWLPRGRKRLPIDLYWFGEGLYIVGAREDHRDLIGQRITHIGRLPQDRILAALAPFVPRDNPMRIVGFGVPFFLVYPLQLQAMGAITDTTRVTLGVVDPAGHATEITLAPDDTRPPQLRLMPRDSGTANPLWLRKVASNIWSTPMPAAHAIYVQYNAVADAQAQSIAVFAKALDAALRDTTVHNLVVDLRRNGGGNFFLNDPLERVILGFSASSAHHVWVLVGRHTFSAAQIFATDLERLANATFVGEPSGSRPNFTGENGEVILPYSGVVAEISNENHWSSFWEDQRPWIAPAIPVPVTAADYFSNRDAALDAVMQIIKDL